MERERSRVGGLLLAAGESRRFGTENKLLAALDGTPVVCHAAETLRDSAVSDIVAVVGHDDERVAGALSGIETRVNDSYAEGQSTSVAVGVDVARERDWGGAVFMLGDMPFVDSASVNAIIAAYRTGDETVLAPAYRGQRGNPALFDACHYDALAAVTGDTGGRTLIHEYGKLVSVDDSGVCRDIDRPEDLVGE